MTLPGQGSSGDILVDRTLDRRADGFAQHHHCESDVNVYFDAVVGDEDAAGDALAAHAKMVAFPFRSKPEFAAEFLGDLVDAAPGFLGAERVLAFDFQDAAIECLVACRGAIRERQ